MKAAVTFDFGQTLAELDHEFLQRRLSERGDTYDPTAARSQTAAAWNVYGQLKDRGHAAAWRAMIHVLLEAGGIPNRRLDELSTWLWSEQPAHNLWRQPIPGMMELVLELRRERVPVGIISNSEGKLAELVAELGWAPHFEVIVDSGKLGIDKPDPRIFQHACTSLSVTPGELVHVGDAWEADVQGALRVGARAVWFDRQHHRRSFSEHARGAADAAELRALLVDWDVLAPGR